MCFEQMTLTFIVGNISITCKLWRRGIFITFIVSFSIKNYHHFFINNLGGVINSPNTFVVFVGGATTSSINKHFKTNMIYIVSQVKQNKFNTSYLIIFVTLPFWFLAQHDLLIGCPWIICKENLFNMYWEGKRLG
jgi:hypothetical protein